MPVVPVDRNSDQFYEMLSYRPDIARAWKRLDTAMHAPSSTLPWRLKENARRYMAKQVGCEFCASFGDPEPEGLSPQEQLALEFTERLIKDHRSIDETMIAAIRSHFSEEQLVELIAWTCFKLGANVLGAVSRLDPAGEDVRATAARIHQSLLEQDQRTLLTSSAAPGNGGV
jgi:alkylhydroperoxidase family enzyme